VICLLAASVKAIEINLDGCPSNSVSFSDLKLDAGDTIDSIRYSSICGLEDTTIYEYVFGVTISRSSLYYIPEIIFTTFPDLQMLWFDETVLQEISLNTFQQGSRIISVSFSRCTIKNLPAFAFASARSLQEIFISYPNSNSNTMVDPNAFRGSNGLTQINVFDVNMTSIQKTSFVDSPNLARIVLDNSQINFVDPSAFATLKNLQLLSLGGNKLTSVDKTLIQNNLNLNWMNLRDNQLTTLDETFFIYNTKLRCIELSGNRFTNINANLFANNPGIETLNLDGNRLTSLPATLFQKLTLLSNVNLSNNALIALDKNQFTPNTHLVNIYLQNNKLNAIYNTTFSGLTKLYSLNLLNNVCINANFTVANQAAIVSGLAKCDANANANIIPVPNCDKYVTAIKNLSGMINSTIAALANLSQALTQITKIKDNI
jgi:Leucine-rich repeat (LRR) protein